MKKIICEDSYGWPIEKESGDIDIVKMLKIALEDTIFISKKFVKELEETYNDFEIAMSAIMELPMVREYLPTDDPWEYEIPDRYLAQKLTPQQKKLLDQFFFSKKPDEQVMYLNRFTTALRQLVKDLEANPPASLRYDLLGFDPSIQAGLGDELSWGGSGETARDIVDEFVSSEVLKYEREGIMILERALKERSRLVDLVDDIVTIASRRPAGDFHGSDYLSQMLSAEGKKRLWSVIEQESGYASVVAEKVVDLEKELSEILSRMDK